MYLEARRRSERRKLPILSILFVLSIVTVLYFYIYLLANPINQTHIYPLTSEPIANPLMGWAPWATIEESKQPHTLVYADLTWREFEPQEGVHDFSFFEKKNQIPMWTSEGKRIVFRFVLDKPGEENHLDIPDWLYEKIGRDGDFYNGAFGSGFSPNYANPVLIEYHRKAIAELGKKYEQSNLIAYIELGSLGHWGEWHVDLEAGIRPLPPEFVRDLYVQHYKDAFPNTHLLMRRPFSIAAQMNLGLYNDMTAEYSATAIWLDWIKNGGEFTQTGEKNGLVPMPDGWKVAPIGGEQSTSLQIEDVYGRNLDLTLQLLTNSHTTFIGPGGPLESKEAEVFQDQINRVLSTIGYRLYVDKMQMPTSVRICNYLKGSIAFGNKGIAPIYYNWPTKLYLFDENQTMLSSYPLEVDLRKILPGDRHKVSFSLPLNQFRDGRYTLGIAIVDPNTNQPAVKFAMRNSRHDLIFALGSFEIKKSDSGTWLAQIPGICKSR